MVELHSWITIRETYEICDNDSDDFIKKINKRIQRLKYIEIPVKVMNGEYYIEFTLFTNHFSEDIKEFIDFFANIGKIAKGSYGLLYIHDDEDAVHNNEFQIWKLTRGEIRKCTDRMLSPFVPTIEDFDTELNV